MLFANSPNFVSGTQVKETKLYFKSVDTTALSVTSLSEWLANSADPDQTAPKEQSAQGEHCLLRQPVGIFRVKHDRIIFSLISLDSGADF